MQRGRNAEQPRALPNDSLDDRTEAVLAWLPLAQKPCSICVAAGSRRARPPLDQVSQETAMQMLVAALQEGEHPQ